MGLGVGPGYGWAEDGAEAVAGVFVSSDGFAVAAEAVVFGVGGESSAHAEQMSAATTKPAMSAQDTFFDGKLLVEANLGRGFSNGQGSPKEGDAKHPSEGGHGHRHGGGGMRGEAEGSKEEGTSAIHESSMPPVALRLRLTNMSKEPIDAAFVLCKSELGDFAVRPEKLSLAPEQSAEPNPMISRLGLTSDELVLTVSLRMAGKVEQKELTLKVAAPETPPTEAKP